MTEQRFNDTTWIVDDAEHGLRLDVFLAEKLGVTRSHVSTSEGIPTKVGEKVKRGQTITVVEPEPELLSLEPENIPLDIVYEDEHLAVINKRAGMVVHPAKGSESGTLVNALLYHLDNLSGINGVARPGIVHRLDKDTTGLLVVAKNDRAHVSLAEQIASKTVCKCEKNSTSFNKFGIVIANQVELCYNTLDIPPVYRACYIFLFEVYYGSKL